MICSPLRGAFGLTIAVILRFPDFIPLSGRNPRIKATTVVSPAPNLHFATPSTELLKTANRKSGSGIKDTAWG